MFQELTIAPPSENDYKVDADSKPNPAVADAVKAGLEAAVNAAPATPAAPVAPVATPAAPAAPVAEASAPVPEPIIQAPLLEVDALPVVASYLGAMGIDIKPIGNNIYSSMASIQNLETLMGCHDSLAESSIYERQIMSENGMLPPGYHPINPMVGGGGGGPLAPQNPTVLQPTPIGTVYEQKTSFSNAVQGINARQVAMACGGGLAIVMSAVILLLATRGLETPAERELAKREAIMRDSTKAITDNNKETTKNMKDLSTKAMDKGNNSFCIGACDNQRK